MRRQRLPRSILGRRRGRRSLKEESLVLCGLNKSRNGCVGARHVAAVRLLQTLRHEERRGTNRTSLHQRARDRHVVAGEAIAGAGEAIFWAIGNSAAEPSDLSGALNNALTRVDTRKGCGLSFETHFKLQERDISTASF